MITKESGLIVQHGYRQKMIKGTVPIVLATLQQKAQTPDDQVIANMPTPVSFPPPVTNPPTSDGQAPEHTSIPAVPPASSPSQAPDSSSLSTAPGVPLVESSPLESSNLPPVQFPSIPPQPPAAEAPVASIPPTNSSLVKTPSSPAENSLPPPNIPPTQDSYCPAATHFNRFSSGPNYIPQSGYNSIGPGLSAQVGNRSHEMAGNFSNVPQSQSNTNTIVVLQNAGMGGPMATDFNLTNYL